MEARRYASAAFTLAGALVYLAAGFISYGSECSECTVIAPDGADPRVWLPAALSLLIVCGIGVVAGAMMAARAEPGRFLAGFVSATGLLAMALMFPYAVHYRFPFGGLFGLGGMVGLAGGALILLGGWLLTRLTSVGKADAEPSPEHSPPLDGGIGE